MELYRHFDSCPLCGSRKTKSIRQETNTFPSSDPFFDRYRKSTVQLLKCEDCEFAFVDRLPTDPLFFSKLYAHAGGDDDYTFKYCGKYLRIFPQIKRQLRRHKPHGKLLDIGAGTGAFLSTMKREYEVSGLEISTSASAYARSQGISVQPTDIHHADVPGGSQDIATLIDVLEHLPEPLLVIRKVRSFLKEGGIAYVKVPNYKTQILKQNLLQKLGLSKEGVMDNFVHINHFSVESLSGALKREGFRILEHGFTPAEVWMWSAPAPVTTRLRRVARNIFYDSITGLANELSSLTKKQMGFNFYVIARKMK